MLKITQSHFTAKTNFKSLRKEGLTFDDFEKYNKTENITLKLKEIISDKKNYISEGKTNAVYKLPNTNNFLLKIYKGITPETICNYSENLTPSPDIFSNINIGQPIARMGKYILFLIKQDGEQHSIAYINQKHLSSKDIKKYLSDIKKIAKIPQKSYSTFMNEVKELTKNNYYIDYFNSNNLLTTKTELNLVDTVKITQLKQRAFMFPSKESIMKILLDEKILTRIFPIINGQQKQELSKNIKTISQKVEMAMEKVHLPQNKLKTSILNFLFDTFYNKKNYLFTQTLKNCLTYKKI